jgi:hypothetical protein
MSLEATYKTILLEKYLKEKLQQGDNVSAIDLIQAAESLNNSKDFTQPQFATSDHEVENEEEASASKINKTFEALTEDLEVVYKEVVQLSDNAISLYERYKTESNGIKKELIDIEEEIENLLLLSEDTEGYHSIIVDNFTDLESSNLTQSTVKIDIAANNISLKPNNASTTQKFLNNITEEDISFRVRSNILGRADLAASSITNVFKDTTQVWHTCLYSDKIKPIVCELIVKLGEEAIAFNRIQVIVHDGGNSGTMSITPLYSTDDISYSQLPSDNFSQYINNSCSFFFPEITAKYMKFVLVKNSPDPSSSEENKYQFGFRQIGFFGESFTAGQDNKQIFESNWLTVLDENGESKEFEKLVIETCDEVPAEATINYYVATSNTASSDAVNWYPITPINRDASSLEILHPKIFEVGAVANIVKDGIELYKVDSPTGNAVYAKKVNGALQETEIPSEINLYSYLDVENDGILNYLLYNEGESAVTVRDSSLAVYRNVGQWEFIEPYYHAVVEVKNAEGTTLQTEDQPVSIDDGPEESGEVKIPYGFHRLKIYKQYYGEESTHLSKIIVNKAFLIKKRNDTETFKIKFNLINDLRKYVKLKAELETTNSSVTPSCDGYQIKIA